MKTVALLALVLGLALAQGPNEITNLPGAPANLGYRQYAGYVTVDESNGRNLFYWLVESQNDPATDPLVLWLNGGPGCSSLEGLLAENGPLYVNPDGATLRTNPSAWNRVANVVYLESPAGVGFSYSEVQSDYTVGDVRTAADSVVFLHKFLQMYPQYQGRPFWITGESYGGHYVPNLALAITNANAAGEQPLINLQGFQVGNAWTDAAIDNRGAVEFWWTHAIISDDTRAGIEANCDFSKIGPLLEAWEQKPLSRAAQTDACSQFLAQVNTDQQAINIYDVYTDICVSPGAGVNGTARVPAPASVSRAVYPAQHDAQELVRRLAHATALYGVHTPHTRARGTLGDDPDPCVSQHLDTYLNTPSVQTAIHANISYPWYGCSPLVNYSYSDLLSSMLPVYTQLLAVQPPLHMLVYSGDVDGIVPITGTRAWLAKLNLPVVTPWHPWLLNQQTGGWSVAYQGLTFASVRNAGHMVPWTEPERSFALFSTFLSGQPI